MVPHAALFVSIGASRQGDPLRVLADKGDVQGIEVGHIAAGGLKGALQLKVYNVSPGKVGRRCPCFLVVDVCVRTHLGDLLVDPVLHLAEHIPVHLSLPAEQLPYIVPQVRVVDGKAALPVSVI